MVMKLLPNVNSMIVSSIKKILGDLAIVMSISQVPFVVMIIQPLSVKNVVQLVLNLKSSLITCGLNMKTLMNKKSILIYFLLKNKPSLWPVILTETPKLPSVNYGTVLSPLKINGELIIVKFHKEFSVGSHTEKLKVAQNHVQKLYLALICG